MFLVLYDIITFLYRMGVFWCRYPSSRELDVIKRNVINADKSMLPEPQLVLWDYLESPC